MYIKPWKFSGSRKLKWAHQYFLVHGSAKGFCWMLLIWLFVNWGWNEPHWFEISIYHIKTMIFILYRVEEQALVLRQNWKTSGWCFPIHEAKTNWKCFLRCVFTFSLMVYFGTISCPRCQSKVKPQNVWQIILMITGSLRENYTPFRNQGEVPFRELFVDFETIFLWGFLMGEGGIGGICNLPYDFLHFPKIFEGFFNKP